MKCFYFICFVIAFCSLTEAERARKLIDGFQRQSIADFDSFSGLHLRKITNGRALGFFDRASEVQCAGLCQVTSACKASLVEDGICILGLTDDVTEIDVISEAVSELNDAQTALESECSIISCCKYFIILINICSKRTY